MYPNPAYYVVCIILFAACAWIATKTVPFYQRMSDRSLTLSYSNLDGLRGLLAISVFFHHALANRALILTGRWDPGNLFFWNLGVVPVSIFFMITGMLFWSQAKGAFDARRHFISRLRRITPLYFATAAFVFSATIWWAPEKIFSEPIDTISDLIRLTLGGTQGVVIINGIRQTLVLNAVWWTLEYEWQFYLIVPLLAWFVVHQAWRKLVVLGGTILYAGFCAQYPIIALFAIGAICSELANVEFLRSMMSGSVAAAVSVIILVYTMLYREADYSLLNDMLLIPFFLSIACRNSIFGALTNRPMATMGIVSYSIYLIHMPIAYVLLRALNKFVLPLEVTSVPLFWIEVGLAGCCVIAVSLATYRWIEYPFQIGRVRLEVPIQGRAPVVEQAL